MPDRPLVDPDADDFCMQKDVGSKKIKLGQDISQYFDRRKVLPVHTQRAPVALAPATFPSVCGGVSQAQALTQDPAPSAKPLPGAPALLYGYLTRHLQEHTLAQPGCQSPAVS